MSFMIKLATVFSGIGAIEHALNRMGIENTIVFLVSFWYNKSVRVRVLLSNEPTSPHFNNGSIFLMRGKKDD